MSSLGHGETHWTGGNFLPPLEQMEADLTDATDAYFGEPGHSPGELPNPREYDRRADIPSIDLPPDRDQTFRAAMSRLGLGREWDEGAEAAHLSSGWTAVVEAGQAHKDIAELDVLFHSLIAEDGVRPRAIIFTASPDRLIEGDERIMTARVLSSPDHPFNVDDVPPNEYELARLILTRLPGFRDRDMDPDHGINGPFDMGYNYTLAGNPVAVDANTPQEERGRFMCIGVIGHEIPVVLLRVDRTYYEENGERRYRQPDDQGKMRLIAQQLQQGGASVQQVGLITSNTYLLSRAVAAAQVEHETGVMVRVLSYGTATLARVKNEAQPAPLPNGQLAGEARLAWQRLQQFRNESKY